MNSKSKHILDQITKHYGAFGDENDISPISKIDIEIINELVELLKKYGNTDVQAVMDAFKKKSDYDIAESLIDLNICFEDTGQQDSESEDKLPYWLHFNDIESNRVMRVDVKKYKPFDIDGDNRYYFGILVNEIVSDSIKNIPIISDLQLLYYTEEERNEDLAQLDNLINY